MSESDLFPTAPTDPPDAGLVAELLTATGIVLLADAVRKGAIAADEMRYRATLVQLADKAPSLCRQGRDAARNSPVYAAVMFYERTRLYGGALGANHTRCFFNGLPRSLPLFGAPVAIQFPVDRMRDLGYTDVLNERLHTISKLEKFEEGSFKLRELAQQFDHLPDVSADVPLRVRIFLSRTRTMCEGIRACKPAHHFRQCAHVQCNRLFMSDVDAEGEGDAWNGASDHAYWTTIARLPAHPCNTKRFCSAECARQWWLQLDSVLRSTVDKRGTVLTQLHRAPDRAPKASPSATGELQTAIVRNSKLKSAIGKLHRRRRALAPAVARLDFDREVHARVTRANVDLGVLYATTKAVGVPHWHAQRRMPGDSHDWRDRASRETAERALKLYKEHEADAPIDNMLKGHSFLRACKERPKFVLGIL